MHKVYTVLKIRWLKNKGATNIFFNKETNHDSKGLSVNALSVFLSISQS